MPYRTSDAGAPERPSAYLRQPTVSGDLIAFVAEDDIWVASLSGGVAERRTVSAGEPSEPLLSPDGSWLAFVGRDTGEPEAWWLPTAGGIPERMTSVGVESLLGFDPDGRLVVSSATGQPFGRPQGRHGGDHTWPYAIGSGPGGPAGWAGRAVPERLPFGPVSGLAFGPAGADGAGGVALGRNAGEPAWWKRYRGGTAGQLWVRPSAGADTDGSAGVDGGAAAGARTVATGGTGSERGSGEDPAVPRFARILSDLGGSLACPMWLGERVYFLSDHEGIGNLYSVAPDGSDLTRHSAHEDFYARDARSDGRVVVYAAGGRLYRFAPGDPAPEQIPVVVPGARPQRRTRFVDPAESLAEFALHPAGHSLAAVVRGKPFTLPLFDGAARQHGLPQGVRYRLVAWLGDGSGLAALGDEGGEDELVVLPVDGGPVRSLGVPGVSGLVDLAASPDGQHLAVATLDRRLLLVEVSSGAWHVADEATAGWIRDLTWSADSSLVAYAAPVGARTTQIRIARVAGGSPVVATTGEFADDQPVFDPAGKWLAFLSRRSFDPVPDAAVFDYGFPVAVRPYLVTLVAGTPSPLRPEPRGMGEARPAGQGPATSGSAPGPAGATGPDGTGEPTAPAVAPVELDAEGLPGRILAVPVPEGRYDALEVVSTKLLLRNQPVRGARSAAAQPGGAAGTLEAFDLATGTHEVLASDVAGFAVSADRTTLVARLGKRLRAMAAGAKPPEGGGDAPGRATGWIDLGRIRVEVDPPAEWRQMLREAWRLQRDHFWVEDLSGVDWPAVLERYLPLVDAIATRADLSDLLWELQGELGTSHAYEIGGDHRRPPSWTTGRLGADLDLDAGGVWRVRRVVKGDPWSTEAGGPLAAVGVEVVPGEGIVEVAGLPVGPEVSPAERLVNRAGVETELTVVDVEGTRRRVVVRPLADERPLRYRDWVARNRAYLHEASAGRVGYVHVPDMGAPGFSEFFRAYQLEVERDALVIDVRHNGGGHVSGLLIPRLAMRRLGEGISRWQAPEEYPELAPAGPLVALADEWAGSDGDIFTHAFRQLGLGPVVGTRTWGGVVGISPSVRLVDGTVTTQPEYAFWFTDVAFGVENYGVDPDVEVPWTPEDHAAGRDPQLERALALALDSLGRTPRLRPDLSQRPPLPRPPGPGTLGGPAPGR